MPSGRPTESNDARLIERAAAGDKEAFGDLYERHLPVIFRYVYYRVGDVHDAEDLTETVFLKAWQALNQYRPTGAGFTSWLYRIAHNLLVDRHRTYKPLEPLENGHPDSSDASNPESSTLSQEQHATITGSLARLDPVYQQVLTLRFVAGLSHTETAQIVGQSVGSVRVIQHRALNALRLLMEGGR